MINNENIKEDDDESGLESEIGSESETGSEIETDDDIITPINIGETEELGEIEDINDIREEQKVEDVQYVQEEDKSELKIEFDANNCGNLENQFSKECNKFLLKKELMEYEFLSEHPEESEYLYPSLNDPNFNIKIAERKEFNETQYDGSLHDIKEHADYLSKLKFEFAPHQIFVRNFLSFQTPYNSLLLYHGLGTGKTLASIGVCEEMRVYLKQLGIKKQIMIIASPNVQDNFKIQLFDERKLKLKNGLWQLESSIGNNLLKEINPTMIKDISKEKIIHQIKVLINNAYTFMGYDGFANYVRRVQSVKGDFKNEKEREKRMMMNIQKEFNNRLLVIDEIHNIRISEDNENKKVALYLMSLVKNTENMRLLLLSATPMYNSYKEIIWLINLMNANENRGLIEIKDVFDKKGNFKEGGEELLVRKLTGYVSFVRGENPYIFPFRVYPNYFSPKDTFFENPSLTYPLYQMNGKKINPDDILRYTSIYLTKIGDYQSNVYSYIIEYLKNKNRKNIEGLGSARELSAFESMESFGYTLLQMPVEALNIVYPIENLTGNENVGEDGNSNSLKMIGGEDGKDGEGGEDGEGGKDGEGRSDEQTGEQTSEQTREDNSETITTQIDPHTMIGKVGLERMMDFVDTKIPLEKGRFEYKEETISQYGRIFSLDNIGKYSSKIKNICDNVMKSEGLILIYSQYIDAGLIPMALALEEMGFTRYGSNSLFKTPPTEPLDSKTMKPRVRGATSGFKPARYTMITGDIRLSPNNDETVKALTNNDNMNGEKIKVILISRAGSEGVDLKFIRQVHIMDPWYNMNRIEQIIGRAVRSFSHKDLPFEKRNVEIFMHATQLKDEQIESADLYIYRMAEYKAIQIGKITRILKETSVDCLLNQGQTNFTQENFAEFLNKKIKQKLSNGTVIDDFPVGDVPYTIACDYMDNCQYKCRPFKKITEEDINEDTYNSTFLMINSDKIKERVRQLFKERFFYNKTDLISGINLQHKYSISQIYATLTEMIQDDNELVDKYGRAGYLINIDEYYLFQPMEINNERIGIFERSVPIDYKHSKIHFELEQEQQQEQENDTVYVGNQTILKPNSLDSGIIEIQKIKKTHAIDELLKRLKDYFNLAINTVSIHRGEDDWYKFIGVTIQKMMTEYNVEISLLMELLVEHIIDVELNYKEKVYLFKYLYSTETFEENSFEWYAKSYFLNKIIKGKRFSAIVLYNKDKRHILINRQGSNGSETWFNAEPEDIHDISPYIREKYSIKESEYNELVGFISFESKQSHYVFKIKNVNAKRNTGARCDEKTKAKNISVINEILREEKYTKENTKTMVNQELCTLQEFTMRYFNKIRKNGKIWFLDTELAMIYNF
jgi:hypothetical protein